MKPVSSTPESTLPMGLITVLSDLELAQIRIGRLRLESSNLCAGRSVFAVQCVICTVVLYFVPLQMPNSLHVFKVSSLWIIVCKASTQKYKKRRSESID